MIINKSKETMTKTYGTGIDVLNCIMGCKIPLLKKKDFGYLLTFQKIPEKLHGKITIYLITGLYICIAFCFIREVVDDAVSLK